MLTLEIFPRSWQSRADHVPMISLSGRAARRSHDSRDYGDCLLLQLDSAAREKLQAPADHFATS
jgi:hypothetical protein